MTSGFNLINSADVSADHLSITFHLKQAYAPFLSVWVDSGVAPLPAHHFSSMPPEAILKSPENLNPKITSWILACDQIPPKGYNVDFYCNPALDALYQQELATADPGVRQQIFDQIHEIYLKELPFIVLFSLQNVALVHKGIHNYQFSPIANAGETNIWEWWCDGGKC